MCYSEFTDIIPAIDDMDADVITFEASRSDLQILDSLKENHFETEVGPGVYDIHSPRVPSVDEIVKALKIVLEKVDREKLWVNPDCGLKTRGVRETDASLRNMVEAAKQIRNKELLKDRSFILAGGLNPSNVKEGIRLLQPDVVDVSSGVEGDNGKDKNLILEFTERVKKDE